MQFEECRVVSTPQGNKAITSMTDVIDILVENNLKELASFVDDNIQYKILATEAELLNLKDEFDSYAAQNETYHDCIRDTAEAILNILNGISNSKRLNKSELVKRLNQIFDNLWNEV